MQRKGVMTLKSQAIKTNQAEKQRDKKQQKKKKIETQLPTEKCQDI